MVMGPAKISLIAGTRSIGPFIYANPFGGGLMGWIGDPSNRWDVVSYVLVAVVVVTAVWHANDMFLFFERRFKTAFVSLLLFVSCLVVLVQGAKFDPFDWRQLITAGLFGLVFFSVCGQVFSHGDVRDSRNDGVSRA